MKASVQINQGIESLFGTRDENIRLIESGLGVSTHLLDPRHVLPGAADLDGVGQKFDCDIETTFKQVKVFVARTEEGFEIGTKFDVFLHREIGITSGATCADECD